MSAQPQPDGSPAPIDPLDQPRIVDLAPVWLLLAFVLGAFRRRYGVACVAFAAGVVGVLALFSLFPKTYHTETRILAQRNLVMPALGNPRRAVPIDSDTPTKAVSETVLTRENLLSLIDKLDLQQRWEAELAPIQKLREWVANRVAPQTDAQKMDALAGVLEHRLIVTTEEGTVTIGIDWQNPNTAYDIVRQAQDNFLEARHATEVSTIGETISILEHHASDARATMEQTVSQIEKARAEIASPAPVEAAPAVTAHPHHLAPVRNTELEGEIADLKSQLELRRQQIADLQQSRQKEIGQLTAQLAQQRAIYAPAHPAIVATEQSLKNLAAPPPELDGLQREEQTLAEQVEQLTAEDRSSREASPRSRASAATAALPLRMGSKAEEDPRLEYPKSQLRIASDNYEDLLRRIDAARIELDTAQAAFKYRYRVIRPAEIPEKISKPKPILVFAAAILGGLLFAGLLVLMLDLRGDLIHSGWQLEKRLKIPVLVELERE